MILKVNHSPKVFNKIIRGGVVKAVILDDSTNETYIQKIDEYARNHNIEVVRRNDHRGFKAGNLNHYLQGRTDYDYFVILDSDEIIPPNFISRCLQYFSYYPSAGIVQCNHKATRNITAFMKLFHIGVDSHWPVYQTMKHHYGFMSLLGHGAMVSRACYEATQGIPEVVAEDLCFSIVARNKGYYVAFAPNVICEEQYPVDYLAFKKRHSKWTQGNFEFMKRYTQRIITSKMSWFEKTDIILFTYNLPLTVLFTCYILINLIVFPILHYQLHYPIWLLIPTVLFFVAPMINDVIFWARKVKVFHLINYIFLTFCLYGSMFYISLKSSLLAIFGRKAVFVVTPKTVQYLSWTQCIRANIQELMFALVLVVSSLIFQGGILPVVLLVIPVIMSLYLTMYSKIHKNARFLGMNKQKHQKRHAIIAAFQHKPMRHRS